MSGKETLGDGPIEDDYVREMQAAAHALNLAFNGHVPINERKTGFVLLVFPFGSKDGRCNYISNGADRRDVVKLLEEQIKRFKGL